MDSKTLLLELMYIICGLMAAYVGVKALREEGRENKVGTAVFWFSLAALLALGKILPPVIAGVLVVLMTLPPIFNKVSAGKNTPIPEEYKQKMAQKFGNKLFIPALSMGVFALIFGTFIPSLGSLVGMGFGILVAAIMILMMSKDKVSSLPKEGSKILEVVGPLSILPQLLASLGTIFAAAGVGEVISSLVSNVVPEGNIVVAITIYAVAMALFTMIMGNAFAAFSVITIGIGIPFVLNYGLDPNVIGIVGLTSGYCGTLMTPMAANFNMLPVAILDIKDKYAVIKKQVPIGLALLASQIVLMIVMG